MKVFRKIRALGPTIEPTELSVLAFIALACFAQLATSTEPGAIDRIMSPLFRTVWLVILLVGSAVAILGILWTRERLDAVIIELVGLSATAIGLTIYSAVQGIVILYSDVPTSMLLSSFVTLTLALGFWGKARRLQRVVDSLKDEENR